jgi:hypothetical protein
LLWYCAVEFIRRFLLHALLNGFVKIRQYGFLANRSRRENLAVIRHFYSKRQKKAKSEQGLE